MKDKGKSKKVKEEKQTICCDVEGCTYNDGESHCELKEIHISADNDGLFDDDEGKEETICDSFESKDDEDTYDEEEDD
jgi:Domain of Unknown Function (DUF1540).